MYGVVTKAGLWDCSAQSKKLFFHNEGTQQRSQSKWALLSKLSFYLIFPHANQIIPINTELVQDPKNKNSALLVQFVYCCFTKDMTKYFDNILIIQIHFMLLFTKMEIGNIYDASQVKPNRLLPCSGELYLSKNVNVTPFKFLCLVF